MKIKLYQNIKHFFYCGKHVTVERRCKREHLCWNVRDDICNEI